MVRDSNVAISVRIMRPKAKGYYKDKSSIVQIGAAMIDSEGKLAKWKIAVLPEIVEDPDKPFVWDAGVEKDDVLQNGVSFEEALVELKNWVASGKKEVSQYAVFSKLNAGIFLNELEKIENDEIKLYFKKRIVCLQEELRSQFNVEINSLSNFENVFAAFKNKPICELESTIPVENEALNTLQIRRLIPRKEHFEVFMCKAPSLQRMEAWQKKHQFTMGPMKPYIHIAQFAATVVLSVKVITSSDNKEMLGQIYAVRKLDGHALHDQEFSAYVMPCNIDLDTAVFEPGLDKEKVKTEGRPYKTVMYEFERWLHEPKSSTVYTYNSYPLRILQGMDNNCSRNFCTHIFGGRQRSDITILYQIRSLWPDAPNNVLNIARDYLEMKDCSVVEEAVKTRSAKAETKATMALLLAMQRKRSLVMFAARKTSIANKTDENGFYNKLLISDETYRYLGAVADIPDFLKMRETREFTCPVCGARMIVPYWTIPSEKEYKDDKDLIKAIGRGACPQDGKFIATANIRHDADSKLIGWTGIETYNKAMSKELSNVERSNNVVVPIDINERQKLPPIRIFERKTPIN